MGHHQDGDGEAVVEIEEERVQMLGILDVQVAGRFVAQQDAGIVDEGPRQGDALALAAREFGGQMLEAVIHAHHADQFQGALLIGAAQAAGDARWA